MFNKKVRRIAELEMGIASRDSEIKNLKAIVGTKDVTIDNKNNEIKDLGYRKDNEIQDLQQQVIDLNTENVELKRENDELNKKLADYKRTVENQISKHKKDLEALKEKSKVETKSKEVAEDSMVKKAKEVEKFVKAKGAKKEEPKKETKKVVKKASAKNTKKAGKK